MVAPFDYTSAFGQGGPFGGVAQGIQAGAQLAQADEARALTAARMEQARVTAEENRQKALAQQAAIEQKAAEMAELAQLQGVPLPDMTQAQRLRLMQLSNSEVTRGYISRSLEQMTSEQRAGTARRSGSVAIALARSPDIGKQRLQQLADAEVDPQRKKGYQDIAKVAEINPLEAARMVHSMMMMTGDESFTKVGDAVTNYLKNSGSPLYPEAPRPLQIVGGVVLDPNTRQFIVPPRQSQLKTPEEEAQEIRIAREKRPPAAPRETVDPNKAAFRESDAAGNVTFFNAYGQPLRSQAGAAKPTPTFEKTTAQRKQLSLDIDRTIGELVNISKDGGLIDQSTGSGAGRLVDVSAGFFGQATPGAIAIGKLQPIADMVLKMVPRFEGPQSDKDTASYKEAAGQLANADLPTKIRKEAANEIVRLMRARKGQFVTSEMAAEGVAPGAAPAAPTAPRRREIAPGVFVTER